MDTIFKTVDGFFDESVKDGAHAQFEHQKEWRYYEENQRRETIKQAQQDEETRLDAELAACEALASNSLEKEVQPPEGYYNYQYAQQHPEDYQH